MQLTFNQKITRILFITVLLALVGLFSWRPIPVSAHSDLVSSEPEDGQVLAQSPVQVMAMFSEELDTQTSTLLVVDSERNQVDNGDGGTDLDDLEHKTILVSLPPALPDGTYTVQWKSVSAEDEDVESGEFTFIVGSATGSDESSSQTPSGASSWLLYGAIGLGVILLVVVLIYVNRQRNVEHQEG
jgi:methionine-rich copper-binding protein CopC